MNQKEVAAQYSVLRQCTHGIKLIIGNGKLLYLPKQALCFTCTVLCNAPRLCSKGPNGKRPKEYSENRKQGQQSSDKDFHIYTSISVVPLP